MSTPEDPFAAPDPDAPQPARPAAAPVGRPMYGQPVGPPRNGLGTAGLVLGILALVGTITVAGGILLGVLAIIFGALGRGRARRGEATNGGSATAGLVLGAVALVLSVVLIAVGVSFLNSDSGQQLRDCLARAGSDQAAQRECQVEFQRNIGR